MCVLVNANTYWEDYTPDFNLYRVNRGVARKTASLLLSPLPPCLNQMSPDHAAFVLCKHYLLQRLAKSYPLVPRLCEPCPRYF